MDREQYLQMRRTGQYNIGWFYQYFLDNKDKSKETPSFEVFQQVFQMYFHMHMAITIEMLDKKMEVTKVENQKGELLHIN